MDLKIAIVLAALKRLCSATVFLPVLDYFYFSSIWRLRFIARTFASSKNVLSCCVLTVLRFCWFCFGFFLASSCQSSSCRILFSSVVLKKNNAPMAGWVFACAADHVKLKYSNLKRSKRRHTSLPVLIFKLEILLNESWSVWTESFAPFR